MAEPRLLAKDRVPTLTEVVDLFDPTEVQDTQPPEIQAPTLDNAAAMTAEVLFELEQRINSLFEARLREALAPALARAADGLIREARQELSGALRALVEDAVVRALERRTHD